MRGKERYTIKEYLKRRLAALLAGLLFVGSIVVPEAETVYAASEDITYSKAIASTDQHFEPGKELTNGMEITGSTTLFFSADFTVEFVKLIEEMTNAGTASVTYKVNGVDPKLDLSAFTGQDISVMDGAALVSKVGRFEYKTGGTPEETGMFITLNLGAYNGPAESGGLLFLDKCMNGENPTEREITTFNGVLTYGGMIDTTKITDWNHTEITLVGGDTVDVKVKNPDAPVNPDFSKEGTLNENGTVTWTLTVDRPSGVATPDRYFLTDAFAEGLSPEGLSDWLTVKTTKNGTEGAAAPVTVIAVTDTPTEYSGVSENQAAYNETKKELAISAAFAEGETKKVYSVTTKITDPSKFVTAGNNQTDKKISNEASLTVSDNSLPKVVSTNEVTVPNNAKVTKAGEFDAATGKLKWVLEVTNVNTAWLKYLTIYDDYDENWDLADGTLKVLELGTESPELSYAKLETTKTGAISDNTVPTHTVNHGFALTLFDSDESGGTSGVTRKSSYKITYDLAPNSGYYEGNAGSDKEVKNAAWMNYAWKTGTGIEPGPFYLEGPDITGTVASNALQKEAVGTYNPANQTMEWKMTLNPRKINFDAGVTLTDTLGKQQVLCRTSDNTKVTPDTLTNTSAKTFTKDELLSVFEIKVTDSSNSTAVLDSSTIENYIDLANSTYTENADKGFQYVLKLKDETSVTGAAVSSMLSGKTMTVAYKTKVIDSSITAANVTNKLLQNDAELTYKIGGSDGKSAASANKPADSNVIMKDGVGYDYRDGKELIKWKVTVNSNKMDLWNSASGAANNIQDTIEADQDFNVSSDIVINDGSASYTLKANGTAANDYTAAYDSTAKLLTVNFGKADNIDKKTLTITYDTSLHDVDTKTNFGKQPQVEVKNTVSLNSMYAPVLDDGTVNIYNPLVKKTATRGTNAKYDPVITYHIAVNPLHATLPDDFTIQDTFPEGLAIDNSSFELYEAAAGNTTGENVTAATRVVLTKSGADNLIDRGTLKFANVDDASGKKVSQFTFDFNFNNSAWGADDAAGKNAAKKAYILTYKGLVTDVSKTSFENAVKIGDSDYSQQKSSNMSSYSYGNGQIYANIGSTYGRITLKKVSEADESVVLSGAEFRVEQLDTANGNAVIQTYEKTTEIDGTAAFSMLQKGGTYRITEVSPPAGFVNTGFPKVIDTVTLGTGTTSGNNRYYSMTVKNTPSPFAASFAKVDQYGRSVQGAEFGLYNGTGFATEVSKAVSDVNGRVVFTAPGAGTYMVRELSAPSSISFNALTADSYYFKSDAYGNIDGLYDNESCTGDKTSSVLNLSIVPPPGRLTETGHSI